MADTQEPVTLYQRVAGDLRAKIASGALPVGEPIPSTTELRQIHGVSSTVVRAAVGMLRSEGLVEGQPGKAVYVRAKPAEVAAARDDLESLRTHLAELDERFTSLKRDTATDREKRDRAMMALAGEVSAIRGMVEQLYVRLGHPLPDADAAPASAARQRRTGT